MAEIKPFKCLRPAKSLASRVAALPYDVYNREEAKLKCLEDELTFLRIDRAETQLDDSIDTYDPLVYQKAKELLNKRIHDQTFIADNDSAYYIYELIMDGRHQSGIVACASIDDYTNNVIKKHENTRADKEQDRINHVNTCSAQTGPIFLAYKSNNDISQTVNKIKTAPALYSFVSDDGISHNIWKISASSDIDTIKKAFNGMSSIYIADGHHRAASAVKVGLLRRQQNPDYDGTEEFNYFLSVLFPEDELMILPYNRVVKDLNGLSEKDFLKELKNNFVVEKVEHQVSPKQKSSFGMYMDNQWYLLTAKEDICFSSDPVKNLDVSILQDYILGPVLGINDPRTDKRIDFIGGIRGLDELEHRVSDDMKIAFSMYPTSINELFMVSDAGMLMPPKSTWFEPKLRSGLFIHQI